MGWEHMKLQGEAPAQQKGHIYIDQALGEGLINEGKRGRKPGASHSSEKLTNLSETVTVLHFLCLHRELPKNLWVVNSFQILFWKFTLEIYARWTLHMCTYS